MMTREERLQVIEELRHEVLVVQRDRQNKWIEHGNSEGLKRIRIDREIEMLFNYEQELNEWIENHNKALGE